MPNNTVLSDEDIWGKQPAPQVHSDDDIWGAQPTQGHWWDAFRDDGSIMGSPIGKGIHHMAGVTGNAVARGMAGIVSAPIALWNMANEIDNGQSDEFKNAAHIPTISEALDPVFNKAFPQPDTPLEQLYGAGVEGFTAGSLFGGPGARAGAVGGVSSDAARQAGAGPLGQWLAGMAGGGIVGGAESGYRAAKSPMPTAKELMAGYLRTRPDINDVANEGAENAAQSWRAGIPNTLGENLKDDNILRMQAVIAGEPATMGAARGFTDARDELIPGKLQAMAQALGKPQSADEAAQAVTATAKQKAGEITGDLTKQAAPLYEQAFTKKIAPNHPILNDPIVQHYIDAARNDISFSDQIGDNPDHSVAVLDAAKRKMDKAISTSYDPGAPANTAAISAARDKMVGAVDDQLSKFGGPSVYQQARESYSTQPDKLAMRNAMGDLSQTNITDPGTLARALMRQGQTATQQTAAGLGATAPAAAQNILYDALANSKAENAGGIPGAYSVPGKIYATPDQQATINTLAGPANAPNIQDTMGAVQRANLSNRYRANSVTNPLEQAQDNLKAASNRSGLGKALIAFARGDEKGGILNLMGKMEEGKNIDPKLLTDLHGLMTTQDGMALVQALAKNRDLYTPASGLQRFGKKLTPQLLGAALATQSQVQQ